MTEGHVEEKSPLLLYMVEQDENISKNNKRMYFDKTRLHNLTSGASAVFTEFPHYVTSYWITSVLAALIFFMMILLVVSTMSASLAYTRPTRCIPKDSIIFDNNTIHLVHTAKDFGTLQVKLLDEIKRHYPEFSVHLILIHEEPSSLNKDQKHMKTAVEPSATPHVSLETVTPTPVHLTTFQKLAAINSKPIRRNKRTFINPDDTLSINMGVKRLLDMLLHSRTTVLSHDVKPDPASTCPLTSVTAEPTTIKTFEDVIRGYKNLYIENTTFGNAFDGSPLHNTWQTLNNDLRIFALRVVQLWQFGGISFSLEPQTDSLSVNFSVFVKTQQHNNYKKISLSDVNKVEETNRILKEKTENSKLLRFIHGEKFNLEKLPYGVVTADDEGLHIVSKTRCHAFFDEVLMQIKHSKKEDTVKDILQDSLKVFCRHLSVDRKYCDMLMKRRG